MDSKLDRAIHLKIKKFLNIIYLSRRQPDVIPSCRLSVEELIFQCRYAGLFIASLIIEYLT